MNEILESQWAPMLFGVLITIVVHAIKRRSPSETVLDSLRDEGLPVLMGAVTAFGGMLGAGAGYETAASAALTSALVALGLAKPGQPKDGANR